MSKFHVTTALAMALAAATPAAYAQTTQHTIPARR